VKFPRWIITLIDLHLEHRLGMARIDTDHDVWVDMPPAEQSPASLGVRPVLPPAAPYRRRRRARAASVEPPSSQPANPIAAYPYVKPPRSSCSTQTYKVPSEAGGEASVNVVRC